MSALTAHSKGPGADSKDALELLARALEILDRNKTSLAIGARLQEVIEQLRSLDAQ